MSTASSGGRLTMMTPSIPASTTLFAKWSGPIRNNELKYPMRSTGVFESIRRKSRTISTTVARLAPFAKARSDDFCIVGPSASGSENGTPSSRISTPPLTNAWSEGTVISIDGSPAVMKETRAVLPSRLYVSRRRPIRLRVESRPYRQLFGYPCPHGLTDSQR